MRDEQRREVAEDPADQQAEERLLAKIDERRADRELGTGGQREHGEGQDRAGRVVQRRFAHHGLRHPFADAHLAEHGHQRRRIGRGDRRPEERRHGERNAEDPVSRSRGDAGGDDHADGRDHHDGDPHLLQHRDAQRGAAVEQDVAGAEDQDDLVQRRIGLDVDRAADPRAEQHADEQINHHVRNSETPGEQAGQHAGAEDHAKGEQHVLRGLDRGARFQGAPILSRKTE